ncbi:MAG: hypothetical protein ACOCXG_00045 [Nanoarchaeota archaeon]
MLSKKRRLLLFIETFLIFFGILFTAFFLNDVFDSLRSDYLDNELKQLELRFDSFTSYSQFSSELSCQQKKNYLLSYSEELKEVANDIGNFGPLFLVRNDKLSKLKQRELYLQEIRYYNQILKYNNDCSGDKIVPVIYFFNGKATSFDKQAVILENFAEQYENETVVLNFDFHYTKEPILESIKKVYGVTFSPFIIINGKTTRDFDTEEGFVSKNTLAVELMRARGGI